MTMFCAKLLTVSIALLLCASCDDQRDADNLKASVAAYGRTDVCAYVLEKLGNNRMVMLGDSEHGQALFMRTVIAVLNHWVDTSERTAGVGSSVPSKLLLVLERDSLQMAGLSRYFESGDVRGLMDLWNFFFPNFTTSTLEHYHNLKLLQERIQTHNRNFPKTPLSLILVGPEMPIDYYEWTDAKRVHYFLFERDEYSSDRLIDYLEEYPDHKALVFYGNGHFGMELRQKLPEFPDSLGYSMAHYLDDYLEYRGGLYIIQQVGAQTHFGLPAGLLESGRAYAIDNAAIQNVYPLKSDYQLSGDGTIVHFSRKERHRSVYWVKSRRLINYAVDSLSNLRMPTDSSYPREASWLCTYLAQTTGHSLSELREDDSWQDALTAAAVWNARLRTERYDLVGDISSLSLWRKLADSLAVSKGTMARWYEVFLDSSLGISSPRDTTLSPAERADYYHRYMTGDSTYFVLENLIHLLWVGSEREKSDAVEVLQEMTGESLTEPQEWLNFWRQRNRWLVQPICD